MPFNNCRFDRRWVWQYDLDGTFLRAFPSVHAAAASLPMIKNFTTVYLNIRLALDDPRYYSSRGYMWRWEPEGYDYSVPPPDIAPYDYLTKQGIRVGNLYTGRVYPSLKRAAWNPCTRRSTQAAQDRLKARIESTGWVPVWRPLQEGRGWRNYKFAFLPNVKVDNPHRLEAFAEKHGGIVFDNPVYHGVFYMMDDGSVYLVDEKNVGITVKDTTHGSKGNEKAAPVHGRKTGRGFIRRRSGRR